MGEHLDKTARSIRSEHLPQNLISDEQVAPDITAAWIAEAERCAEAYDQGEMGARDWREVMAELRAERAGLNRAALDEACNHPTRYATRCVTQPGGTTRSRAA